MSGDGKLRVHQEAGARLSGVMGKGKGEAWAPATIFISHIVALSRPQAIRTVNKSAVGHVTLRQSSLGNCGKLIVPSHIGAVAQLGERRLCTAEVRGSNPLGSTLEMCCFAGKI